MLIDESPKIETPPGELTPELVQDQLLRILSSSLFCHSRRYPSFLSYVVDQSLKGHGDNLKERTIGVEVFGRPLEYDLATDPIVRQTASEVRKRLAQYYYDAARTDELRIEMHPGSYVPEFRLARPQGSSIVASSYPTISEEVLPDEAPAIASVSETAVEPVPHAGELPPAYVAAIPRNHDFHRTRRLSMGVGAGLLAVALVVAFLFWHTRVPLLDRLWQPVLKSSAPILISVGSWGSGLSDNGQLSIGSHAKAADPVALADTVTAASLQQLLSQHGRSTVIQASTQTSYPDVQRGTTILISGFDNEWTMRLLAPLRFHFVAHDADVLSIEDRENPAQKDWTLDTKVPYSNLSRDFAIVARYHDPTTGQLIVAAAGIGENGTMAAGQLLTSGKLLETGDPQAIRMADARNMEAVIETQVIQGKNGPPRIVALATW